MKNFTYYEAEKILKKGGSSLELSAINLEELTTAKELSQTLDISESTANNWIAERTAISKLGKQAIGYQLMLDLISAYNRIPKSNIVVKKQDIYEIYSKNKDGKYELLATTVDSKLARVIEEINKVYEMLDMSEDFISTEIQTRECSGYSYDELKEYKTDLANLKDLINYIKNNNFKEESAKVDNNKIVVAPQNKVSNDLIVDKKLYDICIPKGALLRYKPDTTKSPYLNYKGVTLYVKKLDKEKYITYKVEKDGTDWVDYKDSFGENNLGNEYTSLRSAFQAILYTKSKSLNETEETEYSIDDGKTWKQTRELKISQSDYNKLVEKIISEHLRGIEKN